MSTYSAIKTRVQEYLIDTPTAVTNSIGALVNKAVRDLEALYNFRVMSTQTGQLVTAVGTRVLAQVPSDFKALRDGEAPYYVQFDGWVVPMLFARNREEALKGYTSGVLDLTDTGDPRVLVEGDPDATGLRYWEMYPLSDGLSDWSDGQYRVVVPYWRYLPDLVGDNDTNWFTVNAEWFITFQAVGHGFIIDWDEPRAALWFKLASDEGRKVIKEAKLAHIGGLETLVPYPGAGAMKLVR